MMGYGVADCLSLIFPMFDGHSEKGILTLEGVCHGFQAIFGTVIDCDMDSQSFCGKHSDEVENHTTLAIIACIPAQRR